MFVDSQVFQARVLASALRLYDKTGIKPNSAYTPGAMLATAGRLTGQTFKRGQYIQAAEALDQLLGTQKLSADPLP